MGLSLPYLTVYDDPLSSVRSSVSGIEKCIFLVDESKGETPDWIGWIFTSISKVTDYI